MTWCVWCHEVIVVQGGSRPKAAPSEWGFLQWVVLLLLWVSEGSSGGTSCDERRQSAGSLISLVLRGCESAADPLPAGGERLHGCECWWWQSVWRSVWSQVKSVLMGTNMEVSVDLSSRKVFLFSFFKIPQTNFFFLYLCYNGALALIWNFISLV